MRRFAVLGHPINHSFSPVMHMASFRSIGFDGEYTRLDVPPEMLGDALKALSAEGFSGVNLTIPHKQLALPMMDALTPEAQRLGAVNTVRFEEGGKLSGHNTDGPGFLAAAKATLGFDPAGRRVAVVGCGGAGRAVAITLAHAGAQVGLTATAPRPSPRKSAAPAAKPPSSTAPKSAMPTSSPSAPPAAWPSSPSPPSVPTRCAPANASTTSSFLPATPSPPP